MLADPRRSRIVLINPTRGEQANMPAEFAARRRKSLALLPECYDVFGVTQLAVGEYERNQIPDRVAHSIVPMSIDGLSFVVRPAVYSVALGIDCWRCIPSRGLA